MVFINRLEELIKLFEECSRSEIGTALLAFEEHICKGLDVGKEELKNLQEIFDYYDEYYSDHYPSLANEALQSSENLILEKFEDYTSIAVNVINKQTGNIENDFECIYNNEKLGYEQDNYFDLVYKSCKETRKQLDEKSIEEILKTYKL